MTRAVRLASLLYAGTILLSRLLGLVREAVIGRTIGGGAEADVFWAAFVIPDFLNYLLASGLLSIVFIPLFQRHLVAGDERAAWRSFSALFWVVALAAVTLTAALWIATPTLVTWVAPGFDAAGQARLTTLTRIVLPGQIFHILGGLLSATLQARDRHTMPALAPVVYVLCVVAGGLLLADTQGGAGFAWGVLIGSALGPFALPLIGAVRGGMKLRLGLRHPDVATWFRRSIPVMLGVSIVVADDWIVKHHASTSAGAISRLQYARTLMKVPMGVFGMAAGMAAFPTLTRLWASGRPDEVRALLVSAVRTLWVLAFAAQAALTVAGEDVARVIWGTGRFTPAELAEIGQYTGLMCLGLWAWSGQLLLARGFYAAGRTWPPTVAGTLIAVAALPLYALLFDRYGAPGLAVASSTALSLYAVGLTALLVRLLGPGLARPLLDGWLRLAAATAAGIGAGFGLAWLLPPWPPLLHGALTGGLAGAVTLAGAGLLGVPEVRRLAARVAGKLRRRR
ncbi:MAG: murein biosynthesis integral membrane protein MurJ [Myxococcales bacterium]|nr:murein biosynthesis integral membrane protein MurJ [Myxococcales bacterium]